MSAPQIPEEAVVAAIGAWHAQYDEPWPDTPPWLRKAIGDELAAAYPHLRRAIIAELLPLIRDLTDPGECWFDHDGGCQEHGYLSLKPGELCPHQEAKQLLRSELGEDGE